MSIKIIFLDIDGVCNSTVYFKSKRYENKKPRLTEVLNSSVPYLSSQLDEIAVERLNKITAATKAFIVISSTWRLVETMPCVVSALKKAGLTGHVIGCTMGSYDIIAGFWTIADRAGAILNWVDAVNPDEWIAIDDTSMPIINDKLIKTEINYGLLDEHVDIAISMLNK